MNFTAKSQKELAAISLQIVQNLQHKIILFEGELGAGKTTLIKEIIHQMGSIDEVSSPTFSIVNEYDLLEGKVYHFDFYRIKSEEEAFDFGVEEYLDSGNYCFIEWPEKIEGLIQQPHHIIRILLQNTERIITFA